MRKIKKYKLSKPCIALSGFFIFINMMTSQAQVLQNLQNSFSAWQKPNLHEKIYVQTDKSFYVPGEIIWFKIYCVDGSTNKMLDLSKVAYVELSDNSHTPVIQAKVKMEGGAGNGSLMLSSSLNTGNYQLRVYTNWMKNFDAGYFFQKQVTIVNPAKVNQDQPVTTAASFDVQFFPEGGNLVKGLESKVAFKITAPDGNGTMGIGAIINGENDTVAHFKTLKFGMGSFKFTPAKQNGYRAVIKVGNNSITKELPLVNESGYVIQAVDHNQSWEIAVKTTNVPQPDIYLIVHSGNNIILAEKASLVNGSTNVVIEKSKLADGVNILTLFDSDGKPLCERLIFKRPEKHLIISAGTNQKLYKAREKVSLTITSNNKDNVNSPANLSVAVFRADSLQKDDSAHIASYLWLCANIKGHIEKPDYYFEQSNDETNQALDNLMLTQGWRQFDWNKVTGGEPPLISFIPEYTGPIITANLLTANNKPAKNIKAYLTVAGKSHQLYVAKSDSTGRLLFNTNDFYGLSELIAQTKWQQDSTYHIDVVSPFSEQYAGEALPTLRLNPTIKNELIQHSLSVQVQSAFTEQQLKVFSEPPPDTVLFYGNKPTYTYKLDDYTRFTTVEEVIHEYVKFVRITGSRKKGFEIVNENKTVLPGEPLVILDGKPIFDLNRTYAIDPLKVKKLDVVTNDYLYGPVVFNGILSFTTYNGASTTIELDPRAIVVDYEGLQLQRKFYSPVYDTEQRLNSTIPDFRTLLYWNPNAGTDKNGQNKLEFYTGDKPGIYIGVIEGISPDGDAGSGRFLFEVK